MDAGNLTRCCEELSAAAAKINELNDSPIRRVLQHLCRSVECLVPPARNVTVVDNKDFLHDRVTYKATAADPGADLVAARAENAALRERIARADSVMNEIHGPIPRLNCEVCAAIADIRTALTESRDVQ